MVDNDFSYWNAMGKHYWPTVYLIDKTGRIRGRVVGEIRSGGERPGASSCASGRCWRKPADASYNHRMQILLFRHGIAEDRDEFSRSGRPDAERPLTDKGERRTRQAAAGLATLVPELAMVATSPYVRASQTADILAGVYDEAGRPPQRGTVEDIQPGGRPAGVCRWLEQHAPEGATVLVGHEPDLSILAAWLTSGGRRAFASLKKAGACLIEVDGVPGRRGGELRWLLPPGALRRLAGKD